MSSTTLPIYCIETCDDIDYKSIFSEVSAGDQFIVRYNRGDQYVWTRTSGYEVVIPETTDYPETHIDINPTDYRWRSCSWYEGG